MRHVVVSAEHTAKWWILTCDEGGVKGRCKRLEQTTDKLRDAIAEKLGLSRDEFVVDVDVRLPDSYRKLAKTAEQFRAEAHAASLAAQTARAEAVHMLASQQLTVRDIGQLLGISHQSVHRLLKSGAGDDSDTCDGPPRYT